ncbi:RidA family protein [Ideonella sp. BN130291]|uniref:RidA family protein n=1 Tax=Ideonella sp. BN130291 TaxID=3112940 RepID=UPI002E270859|nr:RidA family protein [Ideonella sp. BN130291]
MGLIVAASTPSHSEAPSQRSARHRAINPTGVSYCQAHEVSGFSRLLFVSGQVPADADDRVPPDFRSQCRLAWRNVQAQLEAAGMALDDLVKVTVFLSDRRHRQENYQVRTEVLGPRSPALTIVITGIYDEAWLLEIEAVAAA